MANKKILAIMCCAVLINIAHAQRNAEFGKLTDARDGKTYKTTKIAGLAWMAENLDWDGSGSGKVVGGVPTHGSGRIYDTEESEYACPKGWRLPTAKEFKLLFFYSPKSTSGWGEIPEDKIEYDKRGNPTTIKGKNPNGKNDFGMNIEPVAVKHGWFGENSAEDWPSGPIARFWLLDKGFKYSLSAVFYGNGVSTTEDSHSYWENSVRCVSGKAFQITEEEKRYIDREEDKYDDY